MSDQIYMTGRLFPDGVPTRVELADGRIRAVEPVRSLDEPAGVERWITPGFYDLQLNGFAGVDFADAENSAAKVRQVAEAVLRTGCTRFLPTIVTGGLDAMCRQLGTLAETIETDPLVGAMCPGIHVEGPFIHPEDGPRGAHPARHVRPPNLADFRRLFDACRGRLRILTLAPDQPGAVELIADATRRGVIVALGHHRASREQIADAIAAGARLSTHLGNGADALLARTDNYIWTQLGEDRLWASLIADGHHLQLGTIKSMIRAKTPERVVLITDAMAAAGMPAGRFPLGDSEVVKTADGKVCLPGTPYLAGSAAEMPMVIAKAIVAAGLALADAVRLVTTQPARLVPTQMDPWTCEPGKPANLVELDWRPEEARIRVRQAAIGGHAASIHGD